MNETSVEPILMTSNNPPGQSAVTYGGFWKRLAAMLLDFLILLPYTSLFGWLDFKFQSFSIYSGIPSFFVSIWFSVYLVQRYGGTPGKRIMKLRIVKTDLSRIGYQEAILRECVALILSGIMAVAASQAIIQMSELDFRTLGFLEKAAMVDRLTPDWGQFANILLVAWVWGEFLVILTNKKRRGPHDFLAGTVVIDESSLNPQNQFPTLESVQSAVTPVKSPV